jgi:endopeptidase La
MRKNIKSFLQKISDYPILLKEFIKKHPDIFPIEQNLNIINDVESINKKWTTVNNTMKDIKSVLDMSIYGHNKAKRQIERVIGQWITGKQSGYCFGFEGPPGVGKTSLARKGLANCLKDEDGTTRPFSFIALGGSSNGSTLSGHNYTYVGSTWGRIVDILMENKCMNPIIFIDELDKVSKTENGKEIIGILTHLIDPTQNESFQDKYFSGIDLDMSKALFIFSYNDVSVIDKILLDRIHRIKFDNLTLHDKLEITDKYILPELYEKVGLVDMLSFDNEVLKFIIENYTYESGVRKLKEILFEIISEVNLEILNHEKDEELPIKITKDDVKFKYLKDRNEITHTKIHEESTIGIMNGLWANSLGMGGIIPIECFYLPSNNFMDLKLTGLQGDVMKESMNVAKTLAWKLTEKKQQEKLANSFKKTKLQGIHIHCPEGATPKDGPSAGTAITVAIYSLFNNKKIKKDVAITGEINLQGKVSAIGGLELKILGGIKAGIKTFIFPEENKKDYKKFIEKYKDKHVYNDDITFKSVKNIKEVLDIVFV